MLVVSLYAKEIQHTGHGQSAAFFLVEDRFGCFVVMGTAN